MFRVQGFWGLGFKGFPKLRVPFFGGPYNKDPTI